MIQESVLSRSASGAEFVVSNRQRAVVIEGGAWHQARALARQLGPRVDAAPIRRLSDIPFEGAQPWSDAAQLVGELAADGPVQVLCARRPFALFEALQQAPRAQVTPVLAYGDCVLVGPVLDGGSCRSCWQRCLLANVPSLGRRVDGRHIHLVQVSSTVQKVRCALALWERSWQRQPAASVLVVDFATGETAWHQAPALPGCSCQVRATAVDRLSSRFVGLIHSVVPPVEATAPFAVVTASSRVAPAAVGSGCALDVERARRKALFEAVERLAASQRPAHSFVQTDDGTLARLAPYTAAQYGAVGFPYRSPQGSVTCVQALQMDASGQAAVVPIPAEWVTLWEQPGPCSAPRTSTGIAGGPTLRAAQRSALLELAERDCVARCYYEGWLAPLVGPGTASPEHEQLVEHGFAVELALCLRDEVAVPVVVSFIRRADEVLGAYGCAAGVTIDQAAVHALEEGFQMLVHRRRHGRLLPWRRDWAPAQLSPVELIRRSSLEEAALRDWYRPAFVDLSTDHSRAVGCHVASVFSSRAVDVPRPGEPLPLARWSPSVQALARLQEEPDVF